MPSLNLLNLISNMERNYGHTKSQKEVLTAGYKRLLEEEEEEEEASLTDSAKPYLMHQEQLRPH
jgi:hypothetical protein